MNKRNFGSSHSNALCAVLSLLLVLSLGIGSTAWADDNKTIYENTGGSGFVLEKSIQGTQGTINSKVEAETSYEGSIKTGEDGVYITGEMQVGLALELQAMSKQYKAGGENINLSAQGQAKLNMLLGAEGKISAHIDKKGISIGADAKAGAYVSASAEATFEAQVFGVKANVKVYGEAHAGAMAQGTANVTIGFDGKVKFEMGAGVAFAVGASAGMAFEVDASDLMEKYGLTDIAQLVEWVAKFVDDPKQTIDDLVDQGREYIKDKAYDYVDDFVQRQSDRLAEIPSIVYGIGIDKKEGNNLIRYGNWYGEGWSGGMEGSVGDSPPVDAVDAIAMWHDFAYDIAIKLGEKCGLGEQLRLKAIADAIAAKKASALISDPSIPEKTRRYAQRLELLFGTNLGRDYLRVRELNNSSLIDLTTGAYGSMVSNCPKMTPEELEQLANDRVNDWYNDHPQAGKNPYKDWVNPYKDWVNPYKDWVNPYKDWVNPYK